MTTHSSQAALLLSLIMVTLGCGDSTGEKQRAEANRLIQGWPKQGMYLPDAKEVLFFRTSLGATKEVLAKALGDPNSDVRQRAAYVIAELGPQGKPLSTETVAALKKEDDQLIRMYLYNSLSAIGESTAKLLDELRMRFDKLKDAGDQKRSGRDLYACR